MVGSHSARRSGAEMLVRCGWALWQIQFHGRWGSDAVKGYTEEVFAEQSADWALKASGADSFEVAARGPAMCEDDGEVARALRQGQRMGPTAGGEGSDAALARRVGAEIERGHIYVQCLDSQKRWHVAASCSLETPAAHWKTRCGWMFGQSMAYRTSRVEPSADQNALCRKCFGGNAPGGV